MRLLFVITGMKSGGAERVMATLSNELSNNNIVRLVILKDAASDYYISDRVEIVSGNIKNKNIFSSVKFLKSQIEEFKPDLVLSFMTKTNIVSLITKKISSYKCPVVISERANPYYTKGVLSFLRKKIYPCADGCVFQTKMAQNYYKNILSCNNVVIKNPLSRDFNVKPFLGKRKKKIVCTARLSPEKNQAFLIKTFSLIKDKYPGYKLEIYGEGPNRGKLQTLINEVDDGHIIKLMGRKHDIIKYIQDASVFVLPSNSEGMPNALLEAMALGVPSISTDCPIGGPAEIIDDGVNGLLIPMNDQGALIKAIDKIITDEDFAKRIGKKAVEVIDKFNTDKVCKEWENYLINVKENYYG